MEKPHILFVCGRNQWRSPTAEAIYRKDSRIEVRSAGVGTTSKHRISSKDIEWADLILVMEKKHKSRILEMFRSLANPPKIVSLDIPDDYNYMDQELIDLIQKGTECFLEHEFDLKAR